MTCMSRRENLEPKRAQDNIENVDPNLTMLRTDIELPKTACSSCLIVDPNRANPNTEIPEPIFTRLRIEITEPMCAKSNRE